MSNVTSLFGERPPQLGEPNEALVRMLEDVLQMAKSGRLQSMIATGFTEEGNRLSLWSGDHPNVYEMLGALSWLQHEYVDRINGRVT
ncbi:hypothetical protein [Rhizobium sp. AG207R]|uniref:hypothetical protein n=1 Tax=Rhizobium sp. AG207R TaxID=2802287 RepID=UPI0022AC7185|nr:hypothetical protein [Rhizobium sp. AG207R]MCZ3377425.1 hypothetical protein [Rhizobium sp. AG207R]